MTIRVDHGYPAPHGARQPTADERMEENWGMRRFRPRPAHAGYPDATRVEPRPRPIMLEIARASDEHEMWERRYRAIAPALASFIEPTDALHDRDGFWSLASLIRYMASAAFGSPSTPPTGKTD